MKEKRGRARIRGSNEILERGSKEEGEKIS